MRYIFVGGRFDGQEMTLSEVLKVSNGLKSHDWSESRKLGLLVPREELDNQPLVDGYLSPMWDGGRIRYETQEVYNSLSI